MDSLRLIYVQYGKVIERISNPRDITVQSFYNIVKQTNTGFSINESSVKLHLKKINRLLNILEINGVYKTTIN